MALKNSGGIWIRQGKKGKFMSGVFEPQGKNGPKYKFMAFKNEEKEGKQPDYRIVVSDDDESESKGKHHFRATDADGSEPF
jgi:hypothetical protein